MKDERNEEWQEIWPLAEQSVRAAFARPTPDCPSLIQLVGYAQTKRVTSKNHSREWEAIRLHKAFCGHCLGRYRLVQAALNAEGVVRLRLQNMLDALSDGARPAVLRELGEWVTQSLDRSLKPSFQPITLGEHTPEIKARVLDVTSQPTGETVLFRVEGQPEILDGQFSLRLRTAQTQFEGRIAQVAFAIRQDVALELTSAPIQQGTISITSPVRELGLEYEATIPLELLEITVWAEA